MRGECARYTHAAQSHETQARNIRGTINRQERKRQEFFSKITLARQIYILKKTYIYTKSCQKQPKSTNFRATATSTSLYMRLVCFCLSHLSALSVSFNHDHYRPRSLPTNVGPPASYHQKHKKKNEAAARTHTHALIYVRKGTE